MTTDERKPGQCNSSSKDAESTQSTSTFKGQAVSALLRPWTRRIPRRRSGIWKHVHPYFAEEMPPPAPLPSSSFSSLKRRDKVERERDSEVDRREGKRRLRSLKDSGRRGNSRRRRRKRSSPVGWRWQKGWYRGVVLTCRHPHTIHTHAHTHTYTLARF